MNYLYYLTLPFLYVVPFIGLYFIVKLAVKNAIKELKKEGLL